MILPSRVSLLFQIFGDVGGFSGGLRRRLVVLLILVIGLELLGTPLGGFLCRVSNSGADGGFGYQEVVSVPGRQLHCRLAWIWRWAVFSISGQQVQFSFPAGSSLEVADERSSVFMRLWMVQALAHAASSKV
jgi:hypothetical protein